MKRIKKFLSNAWVVGILGSIIATLIWSGLTALHQRINFIAGVQKVFITMYEFVVAILTFKIPVFIILLIILGLLIALKIIASVVKSNPDSGPKWLKYKTDHYKSWWFTWDYKLNTQLRTWDIINLRPVCRCGCELSVKGDMYYDNRQLVCPKCGATYPCLNENTIDDFKKVLIYDIQHELIPEEK